MDEFDELYDVVPTDGGRGTTLVRAQSRKSVELEKLKALYAGLRKATSDAERSCIQRKIDALEHKLGLS